MPPTYHVPEGLANAGMNFAPNPLAAYQGIADRGSSFYQPGREAQLDALNMYGTAAQGQGPSVAESQLRQQSEANARMGMALAARSRGGNLAGVQQASQGAYAGAQAQTNQQAAALRAAEIAQARAMYGDMASQMSQQGLGYDQLAANTLLGGQQNQMQWELGQRGLDLQENASRRQLWGQLAAGGMGMIGGAMGALGSDIRGKQNVGDSALTATEVVGGIRPITYEYKPGFGEPGQRVGIPAQDLERTPAGASIVLNTPHGKMLDAGQLAALGVAKHAEDVPLDRERDARLARLEELLLGGGAGQGGGTYMAPGGNMGQAMYGAGPRASAGGMYGA